jgi:hypothetical protein
MTAVEGITDLSVPRITVGLGENNSINFTFVPQLGIALTSRLTRSRFRSFMNPTETGPLKIILLLRAVAFIISNTGRRGE